MRQHIRLLIAAMLAVAPVWATPSITLGGAGSPVTTGASVQLSQKFPALSTGGERHRRWQRHGGHNYDGRSVQSPGDHTNPNTLKVSAMAMGITGTSSLSVIRPKANLASYYPCELTTGAFTMSIGGTNFAPDMILQASGLTVTTSMCRRGARRLLARFRPA